MSDPLFHRFDDRITGNVRFCVEITPHWIQKEGPYFRLKLMWLLIRMLWRKP